MFEVTKKQAFANFPGMDADVLNVVKKAMNRRGFNNATGDNKLQLNLSLVNATAALLTFELFSYLDSFLRRIKSEYVTGAFLYTPVLSIEGLQRAIADTGGLVGFDSAGNLDIIGANFAAARGQISCDEISYHSLFAASAVMKFNVAFMRMTTTTDAQIDKAITYFQKSFSGGIKQNQISPRSYFRPNQFQSKTLDIMVNFPIEIDKGLKLDLLAGETVRLSLFISI
jgi:hypothetical protein